MKRLSFAMLLTVLFFLPSLVNAQTATQSAQSKVNNSIADFSLETSLIYKTALQAILAPVSNDKCMVRYGSPDTKEKLAEDAKAAEENEKVGIHGVSVIFRKPPTKGDAFGKTTKKKLEDAGFTVTQTGKNKSHYTVTLPKPVTQAVADKFNGCFEIVTPPKEDESTNPGGTVEVVEVIPTK
jgi:hypothetical protein